MSLRASAAAICWIGSWVRFSWSRSTSTALNTRSPMKRRIASFRQYSAPATGLVRLRSVAGSTAQTSTKSPWLA